MKKDITIVAVTHRESLLAFADQVIRLSPMATGERVVDLQLVKG